MKNILLFGSTGQLGRRIVKGLAGENWNLTAFVRPSSDVKQLENNDIKLIYGDVNDADNVAKAFSTHYHLVISSLGSSRDNPETISKGMSNIVQHFKADNLIAVGGAGILPDSEYGRQFEDPRFPPILKAIATEHWKAYAIVANAGINYMYLCPPRMIPGSFNDRYSIVVDESLKSPAPSVSFEACAAFIVKQAYNPQFRNKRIGILNSE